ncbi:unnamed protein product, partial [Ceratitis capitata]
SMVAAPAAPNQPSWQALLGFAGLCYATPQWPSSSSSSSSSEPKKEFGHGNAFMSLSHQ